MTVSLFGRQKLARLIWACIVPNPCTFLSTNAKTLWMCHFLAPWILVEPLYFFLRFWRRPRLISWLAEGISWHLACNHNQHCYLGSFFGNESNHIQFVFIWFGTNNVPTQNNEWRSKTTRGHRVITAINQCKWSSRLSWERANITIATTTAPTAVVAIVMLAFSQLNLLLQHKIISK